MTEFEQNMIRIRGLVQGDVDTLCKLAAADEHLIIAPTHVVEKGPQMVGYLSLAAIPTVLVWMDTQRTKARDSMQVLNFFENTCRDRGAKLMSLPCVENSPYRPFLERIGYVDSKATMFLKQL